MNYGTLPSRFMNAIDNLPNPRAQMVRRDGRWEAIASQEFLHRVAGLSTAFVELGVKPCDRVGLFSANRPEWHTADFAITGAGGVTVPVYFHESPDRMTYILKHCGAKVVFVAGAAQLQNLLAVRKELPELEQIVVADAGPDVPTECLRYETLIACATAADVASYRLRASHVLTGQLASLIYTSGTTGEPKGVTLTHSNFCSNVTDLGDDFRLDPKNDVALSFLPLAHVYGRTLDYIYIFQGAALAYVESIDAVAQALLEVRPTVTAGVPRFFEKIYARLVEQGSRNTGMKRKIFDWAMKVAQQAIPWRTTGVSAGAALKLQWKLADRLVYRKIRLGSSGKPIANVQVRIAEDGEILVKGPCVMQGYYKNPEATAEVLSDDGWFRTGDIGYLDKDNYLYITDRKKDLLKTAAGKFVAPQPIENALKTSPYILNAMVVGDKRKFIVALIVPNPMTVSAKLAEQGIKFANNQEMVAHSAVQALIDAEVKRLTVHLAQYETIKRFGLLPEDFTFDNGSLTFTLKLKRRVVEQQYSAVIESLYADVAEPRPILQD